ncbi:MAG: heavy metal-associated domain-containing protein [Mariprofundaceae bacterium]
MRILQYLLMIGLLLAAPITIVSAQDTETQSAIIQVDGLSCPFCAYGLEKNLKKVAGVKDVDTDMKAGKVVVELKSEAEVSDDDLRHAVKKAGFTARGITRK